MSEKCCAGIVRSSAARWCCGIALGLALLVGCAAPAAHETPAPADRHAESPAPQERTAAKPAPAKTEPAPTSTPSTATAAPARPSAANTPAKDKEMTPADREALAESIRAKAGKTAQPEPHAATDPVTGTTAVAAKAPAVAAPKSTGATEAAPPSPAATAARKPTPNAPAAAPAAPFEAAPALGDEAIAGETPRMELSPTDFDFAEVWQSAAVAGEFKIKNVGTAPLTVNTRSSCGCTVATKPQSPLEPGGETSFKITYDTSHAGAASKTVTVTTNDPNQPSVVVKVHGSVKALVAATPADRIFFGNLDRDSVQTKTIRLEPKYDTPLTLKLRENQNAGPVAIDLKEIEPGKLYEFTATTTPPMRTNKAVVTLETGIEEYPTIQLYIDTNVVPRVSVMPARLNVMESATEPTEQMLQVRFRGEATHVTDVQTNLEAVKWELLPKEEAAQADQGQSQRLRVTLPPYADVPEGGASLVIFTNDNEAPFQKINVPIARSRVQKPTPTK
jgi:hypothetical protein